MLGCFGGLCSVRIGRELVCAFRMFAHNSSPEEVME